MSNPLTHASFAEIDLDALRDNLLQVRAQVGDCPILAVVKANAYGHGAVRIAQFLEKSAEKIAMFGVAFLEEGIALRESGIQTPILVLTGLPIDQISLCRPNQRGPVLLCSLHNLVWYVGSPLRCRSFKIGKG